MKKRTTLTLDDDNANRLARLQKQRDGRFKEVVNDVIRRGLNDAEKPFRPQEPFRTKAIDLGRPTFQSAEEFSELIKQIQEEDDLEKLKRSGLA
jgi:hypothetical protein